MMERLTSNKPIPDMNMLELAYNSCYLDKERKARYRNYELDIDSRELVKNLAKDMCDEDLSDMSDEEFDEYMAEMLSVEVDSQIGLLALFYRNLWAMADLREKLKEYEDLEEQGRLLKLPCKVGDTVWNYSCFGLRDYKVTYMGFDKDGLLYFDCESGITYSFRCYLKDFKDKIFLIKAEAEAKLKELRGGE
jgi:hypothetical protein